MSMMLAAGQIGARLDMFTAIRRLGLASGLAFCVDPADRASFDSAVQAEQVFDRSGNGRHLYLGGDNSVSATSPTFGGVIGRRSKDDRFSNDGGDYFNFQATPSWAYPWGKDNGVFTVAAWHFLPVGAASSPYILASTNSGSNPGGIRLSISHAGSGGRPKLEYGTTSGVTELSITPTQVITEGVWQLISWSFSEGSGTSFVGVNDKFYALTSDTFVNPVSTDPTQGARIWAHPVPGSGAVLPAPNGCLIGPVCAWTRKLPQSELASLLAMNRWRFAV